MAAASVMAWSGTNVKAQEPFKTRLSAGFAFTPEWQVDQGGVLDLHIEEPMSVSA